MRVHITINLLVYLIVIPWVVVQVLGDESDSAACSKLIVNACQGTKMEDYASGIFVPFNGYCEGSPSYSKYKKKNGDPVYIFYKPASAKWYISHTGGFASTCETNLFNIDAVIFDAANEPYKETGDDDGEAKCNNGLDNDTNRQSFEWRPITIECAAGGGNGATVGGAIAGVVLFIAASFLVIRYIRRHRNNSHQQLATNGNGSAPSPAEIPVSTGNTGIINSHEEADVFVPVSLPPPTTSVKPDIHVTSNKPSFPVISAVTVNGTKDTMRPAAERLQELENIRKFITEEEYNTKKQKILDDV